MRVITNNKHNVIFLKKIKFSYPCWLKKNSYKKSAILLIFGILQIFSTVYAHSPHDEIDKVVISPNYSQDHTVYSLERNNLLRSINRGLSWKRLGQGLDYVSGLTSVAIDPTNPNVLYLSTGKDGIYKSENAGKSWYKINEGLGTARIDDIYVTPPNNTWVTTGVLYAVSGQHDIYKIRKGRWVKIFNDPAAILAIASLSSGRTILIGDAAGNIFHSLDAGFTWTKIHEFANCGQINAIATLNTGALGEVYYVGTSKCGIFRTANRGKIFYNLNKGITDIDIRGVAMSPNFINDKTVFASTATQAIFASNNSGSSWQQYSEGIVTYEQGRNNQFRNIAISPSFRDDKTLFLAGFGGLFKSGDAGIKWQELNTMPGTLIQSIAISPNYSNDKTLALTTYTKGVYLSKDGAASWTRVADNVSSRNSDIAFSPSYELDGTLFFSVESELGGGAHVARSINRGLTWSPPSFFLARGWATILAISPNFLHDKTLFVADRSAHIYESTNGGITYSLIYNAEKLLDPYATSSLAISPNFANDKTLFIATVSGIHLSKDGGHSWTARGAINTFCRHSKITVSPDYAADHIVFIASEKGLFRSKDGFNTWHKISNNSRGVDGYVEELAISPNFRNDKMLIISVKGKGLFKSQDQGWTFAPIATGLIHTNNSFGLWSSFPVASSSAIRFSPNYVKDKTIFATSSTYLHRSRNGGKTWDTLRLGAWLGHQ